MILAKKIGVQLPYFNVHGHGVSVNTSRTVNLSRMNEIPYVT